MNDYNNLTYIPEICSIPILKYYIAKNLSLEELKYYIDNVGAAWTAEPVQYFYGYSLLEPAVSPYDRKELLLNCMYCNRYKQFSPY